MVPESASIQQLQSDWKEMFQKKLPVAATTKSDAQPKWPVHVDHCFARIILDKKIGIDVPWMDKLKSPAYKNMTEQQLRDCIQLGEEILNGNADIVDLNRQSLDIRGKRKGLVAGENQSGKMEANATKRKRKEIEEGEETEIQPPKKQKQRQPGPTKSPFFPPAKTTTHSASPEMPSSPTPPPSLSEQKSNDHSLDLIKNSTKTPFQKRVLSLLCQIPRGHYTTYGSMSKFLNSSPRAVGNALRNNPFAPMVPCHRVLATGGGIGGFHGSWGRGGKEGVHDQDKRRLLREEGVKFDGKGRVVGGVWDGFV
ncbi:hypothetical protein BP6252_09768 [Coleophoma cylindrospora]|uniref:Methylated-DNA--protein-cysteine methyltransferase n=1 Tax=Coleophoma cylindrospora TaxID=1849047 RepID=A0A3D8QWC0_9HELO|nr:hypothetical protein BP6252_09768 [Coleophoma cylindrospora]